MAISDIHVCFKRYNRDIFLALKGQALGMIVTFSPSYQPNRFLPSRFASVAPPLRGTSSASEREPGETSLVDALKHHKGGGTGSVLSTACGPCSLLFLPFLLLMGLLRQTRK